MPYVYILYSEQLDRFYVGQTTGAIEERLRRHLSANKGFTAKARDWKLAHSESFVTKQEALARERQIKAWKSRDAIERLLLQNSAGSVHSDSRSLTCASN
jgi:putative endonuclease